MKTKLLGLWSSFVYAVAGLSTCDRTRVGCLLLSLDGERLLAFGYNGGPRGMQNTPEVDTVGGDFWIHAEANALVKPRAPEPFLVLATHTPCVRCAGLLINSGARRMLFLEKYRDDAGWRLLRSRPLHSDDAMLAEGVPVGDLARWL